MAAEGANPELSKLVQDLERLRVVECRVCKEVLFPPIYICSAGHNICKSCKPKLKECTTCKATLTSNRNYTVEQIVLSSKHSCPYETDGCKIKETGESMESHIQKCQYRPFVCPAIQWDRCDTMSLRLFNVKDHFLKAHRGRVRQYNGQSVSINTRVSVKGLSLEERLNWMITNLIEFDGMMLFGQTFSRNHNHTVRWTVLIIGTEEEARNFQVEITCQFEKERKLQWTIPVEPVCKGEALRKPDTPPNVFIPSCSFSDFKMMVKLNQTTSRYEWVTSYNFKKMENVK